MSKHLSTFWFVSLCILALAGQSACAASSDNDGIELPEGFSAIVFADGFAGKQKLQSPSIAEYRPVGLARGPDEALYISDDSQGRIWRLTYNGGPSQQ